MLLKLLVSLGVIAIAVHFVLIVLDWMIFYLTLGIQYFVFAVSLMLNAVWAVTWLTSSDSAVKAKSDQPTKKNSKS